MISTAPFRALLLGTDTAGTYAGVTAIGSSRPIDASSYSLLTFYLTSIGVTSGGTVIIEEADWDPAIDMPYSGTWGALQTISASTFTGGATLPVKISPNCYGFVRVRVSATITGGGSVVATLRMV